MPRAASSGRMSCKRGSLATPHDPRRSGNHRRHRLLRNQPPRRVRPCYDAREEEVHLRRKTPRHGRERRLRDGGRDRQASAKFQTGYFVPRRADGQLHPRADQQRHVRQDHPHPRQQLPQRRAGRMVRREAERPRQRMALDGRPENRRLRRVRRPGHASAGHHDLADGRRDRSRRARSTPAPPATKTATRPAKR